MARPDICRALRRALADSAVEIREQARLRHVERAGQRWRIHWDEPGGPRSCLTEAWIDATGTHAVAARRVGARRLHFDRHLGLAGQLLRTPEGERMTGALALETGRAGWWYMLGSEGATLDAIWMTDGDLLD